MNADDARKILKVSTVATHEEVKAAYRLAARTYHPDKNVKLDEVTRKTLASKFIQASEAKELLLSIPDGEYVTFYEAYQEVKRRRATVEKETERKPRKPVERVRPTSRSARTGFHGGQRVEHEIFGMGTVLRVEDSVSDTKVRVRFDDGKVRTILASSGRMR